MAEVLGTVASGIGVAQLAGSLASSIIKLKGYWDEIQDAPDDISFLAREIDSHHLILRSILESQARITSSGRASDMFLEHSLKLCEDSSNELNELVKALGKEMNSGNKWRSKLGATKVVLKKDQLKRLKKRMKNASKVMNLAITWQTNATLQQQFPVFELKIQASLDQFLINHQKLIPVPPLPSPATQMSSINRDITTTSQPQNSECHSNSTPRFVPKDCTSAQISSQVYSSRWSVYLMGSVDVRKTQQQRNRNRFEETEAKYKPPAWLSNRAWQCMYTRDLSTLRWNFNIQTYRTLDVESDFFKILREGDVFGVQEMLANRTAFVNDRFVGGPRRVSFWDEGTPLHIAASNNHLDLCKLLLENGADISSDAARGKTPLGVFIFNVSWDHRHRFQALDHTHALVILRTLIEAGADSELIDQMDILASSTGCPTEMFHYLQQRTLMSSGEISFIDKVYIASRFLVEYGVQSQNVILSYLEDPNFQANVALHRDNIAVKEFFIRACREYSQDNFKDEGMVDLIKIMMSAGMSIHTLDENHETVLQRKVRLCYRRVDVQEGEIWGFEMWLGFLVNLGVDLNTYGEVESAIYKKKRMAQDLDEDWLLENVLGFKYGPRIEDWDLWAIEWRDEYAGDFWKLIENPLQAALANISVPGEWVD
ncbi:uncharacterized protein EAF02_008269 [Botrytis sinoallii]|uniref:uncharacterized protein n=1 Tax=Botrytis sinoallii TaxID=1463999 RepID=UPI0019009808|nr:uncharacterized protein EAF02_008269 [Botrytis sinoallii]KAF7877049.1 hypothetical protein EAF02_008269 [Botrytis sinoallii]